MLKGFLWDDVGRITAVAFLSGYYIFVLYILLLTATCAPRPALTRSCLSLGCYQEHPLGHCHWHFRHRCLLIVISQRPDRHRQVSLIWTDRFQSLMGYRYQLRRGCRSHFHCPRLRDCHCRYHYHRQMGYRCPQRPGSRCRKCLESLHCAGQWIARVSPIRMKTYRCHHLEC